MTSTTSAPTVDDDKQKMTMARMNAGRTENDPFRVRLTPPRRSTRYTDGQGDDDDDDDDDESIIDANNSANIGRYNDNRNNADIASMPSRGMKNKKTAVVTVARRDDKPPTTTAIRQRMPLGGGYGGMFDSYNDDDYINDGNNNNEQRQSNEDDRRQTDHVGTDHNDDDNNKDNNNDGDDDKSSMDDGSVLTKYFRRNRTQIGIGGGSGSVSSLNYSLMGRRRGRTKERMHDATPLLLLLPTKILFYYARLPYRARQFIQLFAFIATLMIGMMNYLIILDTTSSMPNYHGGKGGGGGMIMQQQYANRNKKVRFRDPLTLLSSPSVAVGHSTKTKQSHRSGPFSTRSHVGG